MKTIIKTSKYKTIKTTVSQNETFSLQIDGFNNLPNKIIKHDNLTPSKNIKIWSLIHKNKSKIYNNHLDSVLDPVLKPLLENINLLYKKSLLSKKNTPIEIFLEDFDKNNLDPQFLFHNQKIKYKTQDRYLGIMFRIGTQTEDQTFIKKIQLRAAIQNPYILIHELGHTIDAAYCKDEQINLSDSPDFKPIINLYKQELIHANKHNPNIEENKQFQYLTLPTEIFARCFQKWYDAEIQQYHPNTELRNIFNPYDEKYGVEKQHRIGESIVYKLYNDHPEIQQFFTKHFGGIIPPENKKLFDKQKWDDLHKESTSQSDVSLLEKLSNIMYQTGLSQKEQPSNDIDLDY